MEYLRTDVSEKFEIMSNHFKLVEFYLNIFRHALFGLRLHYVLYLSANQERARYVKGAKFLGSRSSSAPLAFRNVIKKSVILHKICTSVTRETTGIIHCFIEIEVKMSKNMMAMDDKQHVCKFAYNKLLNKTKTAWKCEAKRFERRLIMLRQIRKTVGGEGGRVKISFTSVRFKVLSWRNNEELDCISGCE